MLAVNASGVSSPYTGSYHSLLVRYCYEEAKTCIDNPLLQCLASNVFVTKSGVEPHGQY